MQNLSGNALRCIAWNSTPPVTISTTGKQYFGAGAADWQVDFPADYFANPRIMWILLDGIYTTPNLSAATLSVGVDCIISGTASTLLSLATFTPVANLTDKGWGYWLRANSQRGVKLVSGSPSLCPTIPNALIGFQTGSALGTVNVGLLNSTSALSVDTKQAITLKFWATWGGVLTAGTSITLQQYEVFVTD